MGFSFKMTKVTEKHRLVLTNLKVLSHTEGDGNLRTMA